MFFRQIGGHGKPEKTPCKGDFFLMLCYMWVDDYHAREKKDIE